MARIASRLSLQKAGDSAVGLLSPGTVGLILGFAESDQKTLVWGTPGYLKTSAPLSDAAQEEQVLWQKGVARGSWLWCLRPCLQDLLRLHPGLELWPPPQCQ